MFLGDISLFPCRLVNPRYLSALRRAPGAMPGVDPTKILPDLGHHSPCPVDPSSFLGSTWGMIYGLKYLLRQCHWIHEDAYLYIYTDIKYGTYKHLQINITIL